MSQARDNWGSSIGFILAAAGSAIGLGNLWKFPYITWENGGGSFVLVYLFCIALVGLPVMISEIVIGRSSGLSTVPAFEKLSAGLRAGPLWRVVGWGGVVTGAVVLGYYTVIAGWSISSFVKCLQWSVQGYHEPQPFNDFLANGTLQVGLSAMFAFITALIVMRGISGGIEKAARFLMPVLLIILGILLINAFTLDGIGQTLNFIFSVSDISWAAVLEALGHAFFTLSVGMGAMITYGSYMSKSENITKAAFSIGFLDTFIALIACIIMYSILFTWPEVQDSMKSPVGMLFITIPQLFYNEMTFGPVLAPVFFILVGFAALSSTISMLEVLVALLVDKMKMPRKVATISAASGVFIITALCALSKGSSTFLTNFNPFGGAKDGVLGYLNRVLLQEKTGFFNVLDHFASNWCLPLGGFFITIFVGYLIDRQIFDTELELRDSQGKQRLSIQALRFVIRYIAPLLIAIVIWGVNQGGGH